MEKDYEKLKYQLESLEEEISVLQGRQNILWGVCIVLTLIVAAMFMYIFIL